MAPDLTVVLLGNSGVGKSASGNTILGRPRFESKKSAASVTKEISKETQRVNGKQILVVDTPGILGSERVIQTYCQELLQSSRPCLFLIVVKIDRFTIEQKNAVDAAIRVIGDDGFNKCYLLFTRRDDLDNMTLDDFINGDASLKELVEKFERRCHAFNNMNGGQEQVRDLLTKSGHLRDVPRPTKVRRIVLLGLPRGGKSSSANTILGSDQCKVGGGFNPVTKEAVTKTATVEGRQVTVVDTPGFSDEVLKPRQLYKVIMTSILEARPGPHAFVIVVRIGRITDADKKLFEFLHKLLDRDALRYAMVLFTYGDELKNQSINDLIKGNTCVSELVSRCGGRHCVFDNTKRTNRVQVANLLDKVDEMVAASGETHYTSEMFSVAPTGFDMWLWRHWDMICEWFEDLLEEITRILKTQSQLHRVTKHAT